MSLASILASWDVHFGVFGINFDVLEWSWVCLWRPFWRPGMVLGVSLASILASWSGLGCVSGVHFGVFGIHFGVLGVALLEAQIGYQYL